MIFVYPTVLFLLIIVFVLLFFKKSKKMMSLERVFSADMLEKLEIKTSNILGKNSKFYLSLLVLTLMIIALARPVLLDDKKTSEVHYESFNLAVVLDISKSMQAKDVFPNRLDFAKKSLNQIFSYMSEANIAVIAFANDAFLVSPFSNDFQSIEFLLSNLNPNSLSSQGSKIISSLQASQKIYESTDDEKKVVLLISDGADGAKTDEILQYVKENNFVLHVLNIGTKKGTTLEDDAGGYIKDKDGNIVISKRDDSIAKVSQQSGGTFLTLTNDMSKLSWLSEQIKATVDKKPTKKDKFEGAKELFYYPLSLALFFIFFVLNSPRIPFLMLVLALNTNLKADMLDFWQTYKANESYEQKDFKQAQEHFSKIDKDEALYNKANSLYKQKKYEEALSGYKSIESFEGEKELQRLYNMGNSYANLKKTDEAIKAYEDALKIKDDEDTKYNLDLLKKQKKDKQDKNNKDKDKNKKDKDEKQKKDKNKQDKQDKENKDKQNKGKQDKSKENSEDKQEKNKSEQNEAQDAKHEEKKISEAEAKKWEKKMKNRDFTTRPVPLQKSERSNTNEITW